LDRASARVKKEKVDKKRKSGRRVLKLNFWRQDPFFSSSSPPSQQQNQNHCYNATAIAVELISVPSTYPNELAPMNGASWADEIGPSPSHWADATSNNNYCFGEYSSLDLSNNGTQPPSTSHIKKSPIKLVRAAGGEPKNPAVFFCPIIECSWWRQLPSITLLELQCI
jgi:hypothetical protein